MTTAGPLQPSDSLCHFHLTWVYFREPCTQVTKTTLLHLLPVLAVMHFQPTECTERSTLEKLTLWEANTPTSSQLILWILRKTKIHYHFQNIPPNLSILSQNNPIYYNSLRPIFKSPKRLSLGHPSGLLLSPSEVYMHVYFPIRAICPAHLILLNLMTQ